MKKDDGTRASTPEENAGVFAKHFEKLYGREASFDPSVLESISQRDVMPDLDQAPNDDEIRRAVRRLNDTAPGESGLPAPLFKALITVGEGFDIIRKTVLEFWESGAMPTGWESGLLAILPKKGDLSNAGNYRGIMMLEVAYKIVANIMESRLDPIMESLDHEAQCGFRKKRGCADAIFTVRQLIAKRREHGLETWILLIDLVKAFDARAARAAVEGAAQVRRAAEARRAAHRDAHVDHGEVRGRRRDEDTLGRSSASSRAISSADPLIFYIAAIMETWRRPRLPAAPSDRSTTSSSTAGRR